MISFPCVFIAAAVSFIGKIPNLTVFVGVPGKNVPGKNGDEITNAFTNALQLLCSLHT